MTLWEIVARDDAMEAYARDQGLLAESLKGGLNPNSVRNALESIELCDVEFVMISNNGEDIDTDSKPAADFGAWANTSIFSESAKSLSISLGCSENDFWCCHFYSSPKDKYFLFLPRDFLDIVDIERSRFQMILPGSPPIPVLIDSLVTKNLPEQIPPCFYAKVEGRNQVYGELLVTDQFRKEWESRSLRGADFRQLTDG